MNFIPIVWWVKMVFEIFRRKQFISNHKTTYIGHILASTGQLWTYSGVFYTLHSLYSQWAKIDLEILLQLSGSATLLVVAKVGHLIGITKEIFDSLQETTLHESDEDTPEPIT